MSESLRAYLWLLRRLHRYGASVREAAWVLDHYRPGADPWRAADRLLGEWLTYGGEVLR
jgi:hypothetical protein